MNEGLEAAKSTTACAVSVRSAEAPRRVHFVELALDLDECEHLRPGARGGGLETCSEEGEEPVPVACARIEQCVVVFAARASNHGETVSVGSLDGLSAGTAGL